MKKFLSYLSILFIFMFIGVISVNAVASSSFTKDGYNYKFSWSGLTDMNSVTYVLNCSGGSSVSGEGGNNGGTLTSESGYVVLNANANTLSCKITSSRGEVVTESSINLNSTTSKQEQTTTASTTTTTQAPKSNNANLKSIVVKTSDDSVVTLSPNFSPSVYEYEASVASNIKTINIDATMEDSKANVVISNNVNDELIAGENNKITITVTAEDGTKKQYVVNVKREALTADATLSSLTIKEYKDLEFKSDKFNYTIKIKNNVKKLTLDYVLSDENSTAEVEGNEDLKDGSKVKITVTAEDGTKKVYTLQITKETEEKKGTNNVVVEKNPLIIMGLSIIAFGLIGGIIYVIKK